MDKDHIHGPRIITWGRFSDGRGSDYKEMIQRAANKRQSCNSLLAIQVHDLLLSANLDLQECKATPVYGFTTVNLEVGGSLNIYMRL